MSQIERLANFIKSKGQASYDEVINKAYKINPHWRSETITRGLRRRTDIKAVGEKCYLPVGSHNPIVKYETINQLMNDRKAEISPVGVRKASDRVNVLDKRLKAILSQTQVSWENAEEVNKLKQALKSNNEYLKKCVCREYETN